mgnify:CR=1 FL=1
MYIIMQITARNYPKVRAPYAARLFFSAQPIKLLICGAVVAIDIVNTKAPSCYSKDNPLLSQTSY